jgi:hypothetical protein
MVNGTNGAFGTLITNHKCIHSFFWGGGGAAGIGLRQRPRSTWEESIIKEYL